MEFQKRERIIINGERRAIKKFMHQLAADLFIQRRRTLIIDTSNSLNPHHPAFNKIKQSLFFDYVYCIRTPLPYDLWARLGSSEGFISRQKISILLFTNLPFLFKEMNKDESLSMAKNILKRIDHLTDKCNVSSLVGNSLCADDSANKVYEYLSKYPKSIEVIS